MFNALIELSAMKKFIIGATIQSAIFSLCMSGLIALFYFFTGDRMTNEEVLLTLLIGFVGWFIWTIIDTYIIDKKE